MSVINSGHATEKFRTIIPFETKMGIIIIQAKIKDKPYQFIFDTGAPSCIVSSEIMKSLDAKTITTSKIYDVNNSYKEQEFTKVNNIEIGDAVFSDVGAMVMDLNTISTIKCLDADGLLGSNLFRHATWYIDYEKKEIVVANDLASLEKPLEGFHSIKFFEGFGGVPSIFTYLNGHKILNTTIDSGFGGTICLAEDKMKKMSDTPIKKGYGTTSAGLYGDGKPKVTYQATVDQFSLGEGIDFMQENIVFEGKGSNLVGNGIFKHYHVILDWEKREIYLKKNNLTEKSKKDFGYSLGYDHENSVYINNIYEESEASKKGLQLNDKIISINGVNLEQITEEEWCSFRLMNDNSNSKVLMIEREGKRQKVTLGSSS